MKFDSISIPRIFSIRRAAILSFSALFGAAAFGQQLTNGATPPATAQPATAKTAQPAATVDYNASAERKYSLHDRFHDYLKTSYQPTSFLMAAAAAGFDQGTNSPPEWGQGSNAFGKRFLSSYATTFAFNTIQFGVAAADHEDPRYDPADCPKGALLRRVRHVFVRTVISKKDNGGQMFAISQFAGAYGSGFIANTWYPAGHSNVTNALRLGTFTLVTDLGANFLREFIHSGL
jgi:hypothetical protein